MGTLEGSRKRWEETTRLGRTIAELKAHVRSGNDDNARTAGLRSVCWKTFLLFRSTDKSTWSAILADSRTAYSSLRDHFLRYIERPEEVGSALDPLNDDKNSPWNTLRQDEELRAEIFQDVERCMPEEPYFRESKTQRLLLDILFIYCKMNQDIGYRQGMHELLAPVLWVIEKDAILTDIKSITSTAKDDEELMKQTISAEFIEHDAFTLFASIMRTAKTFYELGDPSRSASVSSSQIGHSGSSPIVERSKRIHEIFLARLDPELATHLTTIEILPQIFLIRWIRLLFGREYPFEQLLTLWDTLFAEDPDLDLVDMICVAMLLRIRWQLLDADYSVALTLLLKYPHPNCPNGPETFVEDAVYLRDNFHAAGGTTIITKYGARPPLLFATDSRPMTPSSMFRGLSPEQKISRRRSPLPSPARFLQQQGGVEALLQGAAKGVFERGERLGINQAVRDAVGEVKKNMQGLSPASTIGRKSSESMRWSLDEGRTVSSTRKTVAALEQRNKHLAQLLDDAMSDLRLYTTSQEQDNRKETDAVVLAIAKLQFVQIYLEDSSMPLPSPPSDSVANLATGENPSMQFDASVVEGPLDGLVSHTVPTTVSKKAVIQAPLDDVAKENSIKTSQVVSNNTSNISAPGVETSSSSMLSSRPPSIGQKDQGRPQALVPTRSSLAQSSFAFMLEHDEPKSSALRSNSPTTGSSPFLASGRRSGVGSSRDKAAFLFGDESDDLDSKSRKPSARAEIEDGFNLESMKREKSS